MNASILDFLKTHGEEFDADIAKALHLTNATVKSEVAELSAAGEVVCCNVTKYVDGKRIDGVSCRLSRNAPPLLRGAQKVPRSK